jgi:hypothetical protein
MGFISGHLATRFQLLAAGLCGLVSLTSCPSHSIQPPANLISYNDFEAVAGWGNDPTSLTNEQAHSGRYSTKVDANNEFSMSYNRALGSTGLLPKRKLKIRGWVRRVGNGSTANIVVQVVNPLDASQSIFWESLPVEKPAVTFNRWMPFSRTFNLPEGCTPEHQLRVYMWRGNSTQPSYLDDVELLWK